MGETAGSIAVTAIINSTREFDREYDYLIPEGLRDRVVPGVRVAVPFGRGNTSREAYVLRIKDTSNAENLKEIKKLLDKDPILDNAMLRLGDWMRRRYICTYSDALKCMTPAGIGLKSKKTARLTGKYDESLKETERAVVEFLRDMGGEGIVEELKKLTGLENISAALSKLYKRGLIEYHEVYTSQVSEKTVRVASLAKLPEETRQIIESNRIRSIQQIRVLEILLDNEYVSTADLSRFAGVSSAVLNTLRKNGYLQFSEIEVRRDPVSLSEISPASSMNLTDEQSIVLEGLLGRIETDTFSEALLHGITGSGKTEVYMQLIERLVLKKKQAIVLVPEISLTPQMINRFRSRFGDRVAVIHSKLSVGEKFDQWRKIREGSVDVAVGARSAVFAPFKKLGAIIVDEEHESSYKSEMTPKYDAREVARQRCRQYKALLLLGTATPSVTTYYKALKNPSDCYNMLKRPKNVMLPNVNVADMRKEMEDGNRTIFSRQLSAEIEKNILNREQTILLLNRRGYSSFVLCRSCGHTMKCRNCDLSLTYHSHDTRLICHHCGYTVKLPSVCPSCGSRQIRFFGTGTQKVEEEIRKQFPNVTLLRMDTDTTSGKNAHEQILKKFEEEKVDILLGTQMIAKGLDYPNVTLVGVLAADAILNLDDYRAAERTFQLITQVSGRAGRGELPGRVVIQTYNTDAYSITHACRNDYEGFYRQEIMIRQQMGYPPFTRIATVILSGVNDEAAEKKAQEVRKLITEKINDTDGFYINGPCRTPVPRINGEYRWRIIIKSKSLTKLVELLTYISDNFPKLSDRRGVRLAADIDPISMM